MDLAQGELALDTQAIDDGPLGGSTINTTDDSVEISSSQAGFEVTSDQDLNLEDQPKVNAEADGSKTTLADDGATPSDDEEELPGTDDLELPPLLLECNEKCSSGKDVHITCSGPTCRPECQTGIHCDIAALEASPVVIDCRPGATCRIDSVESRNFQAQCFDKGNCIADCGAADACEMQCVSGGNCELDCQELGSCALLCDWSSSCIMKNAPQGGLVCPDPGVLKKCENDTWTCNASCPAQP